MNKPKYRKPTKDEEIKAWRSLAFDVNLHRCITMNQPALIKIIERIDAYAQAHSDGNGERSEAEITRNVNNAFWTKIANTTPPEKK